MNYLKFAFFPLAILYELGVRFRNHLYDIQSKKSIEFNVPVIGVGNLVAGGSGKTPMVEYLIRKLSKDHYVSILSRGYGRKTKGFRLAAESDSHLTLGDEPYQMFRKFKESIQVAVGEERALAIPEILFHDPAIELILLDDAYQHRAVKPFFNILLTDFNKPFYNDFILPVGMLREPRTGARRADCVVVTKCPENLSFETASVVSKNIEKYTKRGAPIFFSNIRYGPLRTFAGKQTTPGKIVVVTGIANPTPFLKFLDQKFEIIDVISFPDHHNFTEKDVQSVILAAGSGDDVGVITTEKDYVRLLQFEEQILRSSVSFYYVPITFEFLFDENKFDEMLRDAIIAFEGKETE